MPLRLSLPCRMPRLTGLSWTAWLSSRQVGLSVSLYRRYPSKADGTVTAGTEAAGSVGSGPLVAAYAGAGKAAAAPSSAAADINRIGVLVVSHPADPYGTAGTNGTSRQSVNRDEGLDEKVTRGTFDAVGQKRHGASGRRNRSSDERRVQGHRNGGNGRRTGAEATRCAGRARMHVVALPVAMFVVRERHGTHFMVMLRHAFFGVLGRA